MRILRAGVPAEDDWVLAGEGPRQTPPRGRIIVPLEHWREHRAHLLAGGAEVGVLVPNTLDIEAIHPLIADRPLIALVFPSFSDGRALSQAVILRRRLKFRGELRAVGDIIQDLVYWLDRCGFDAVVPRADQDLEACARARLELGAAYQGAADGQTPVWIRRRAAPA